MKIIKSFFLIVFLASFAVNLSAQETYSAKNDGWLVDLEEAYKIAEKTKKPILANFTGSDWCIWCIRLDKAVFHQPEFLDWAEENVVLLELDFPRKFDIPQEVKVQNSNVKNLFSSKGYIGGFPTVLVFDISKSNDIYDFSLLGKTGYTATFNEFSGNVEDMIKLSGTIKPEFKLSYDPANPPAAPQRNRRKAAKPKKPEPAQNAKGVWHYTCAKGCDGGAGKEEACKGCGDMLKHNKVYHNK